jgi:protein-S-isoprenylcysteine O-methyltransferase Ste14
MVEWLKKMLLEKWLGRAIVVGVAWIGGYLAQNFELPPNVVGNWVAATQALLEILLPILIAWALGTLRFNKALATIPPLK